MVFKRDTNTSVDNGDLEHLATLLDDLDMDHDAAFLRELESIRLDIQEHLHDPLFIAYN